MERFGRPRGGLMQRELAGVQERVGAEAEAERQRQHRGGEPRCGAPAVQEVFPVTAEGRLVAALSAETNVLEYDRVRRKDPVLRSALASIRQTVLEGRLDGGHALGRLGEHDGLLIVDADGQILYISTVAENQYRRLGYSESLLHSQLSELDTNEYLAFRAMETGVCLEQRVTEQDRIWIKKAIPLVAGDSPLSGRELYEATSPDSTGMRRVVKRVASGSLRPIAQGFCARPKAIFIGAVAQEERWRHRSRHPPPPAHQP